MRAGSAAKVAYRKALCTLVAALAVWTLSFTLCGCGGGGGEAPPANHAPEANAGPDQTIALAGAAALSGSVTDDGLPNPPGTVTVTWTVVSGPGTVTFADPHAASTTATFSTAGTYVLRLTASDSILTGTDEVTITVQGGGPVNQPPVVDAGPDQTVNLAAGANLDATVTDDGLPNPPGSFSVYWTRQSGPGTVTFGDLNAQDTTATFSAPGTYVLRIEANDGELSAHDDVTIIVLGGGPVNQPPVVDAGPNQTVNLAAGANLDATVTDDGLPIPPGAITLTWTLQSGPGTVVFGNPAAQHTTATFSATGSYVLRLTASDGELTAYDEVTIVVIGGGGGQNDFLFIHHSVGQDWLDNGLAAALATKSYIRQRNDITYGTDVAPDSGRPDSLGPTPGDLTDMYHWILWFNDYLDHMKIHGTGGGAVNRIIMFKSCFPNSLILSDGTEPGDPFAGGSLADYRAVFRHPSGPGNTYNHDGYTYYALEDIFAANPDTLFIPLTTPPIAYSTAEYDPASAARARQWANWLRVTWQNSYNAAHPTLHNVAVFDIFDILAYGPDHPSHPNALAQYYGGGSGDSHPNAAGDQAMTALFATNSPNFLDEAWAAFPH